MARMLGRISKMDRHGYSWCDCRHCSPDVQGQRQREKRVTQKWLDEYESEADMFMCPRDGLPCTCNRIEC